MIPKAELNQEEQKVYVAVERLAGNGLGANPTTVAYALPSQDVYAVIQRLVDRGAVARVGGAIRVADTSPPANAEPNARPKTLPAVAPPEVKIAEPTKPRPRRKYFAKLSHDPRRAVLEMAARIKFQIEYYGEGGSMRVRELRRSLHAYRYPAAWKAAIKLLVHNKQATFVQRTITIDITANRRLPDPHNPNPKPMKPKRAETPNCLV